MNEDEEEADEEEEASQATQQPASEADLGPSVEEVDAAIRLVSEGLTHHIFLSCIWVACSQAQSWGHGHCQACACITFVATSHLFEACVVCPAPNCVVMWQ